MRSGIWRAWLALNVVAIAGYVALPLTGWSSSLYQGALGWADAAAMVVAVRRYRTPGGIAWLLFAFGIFANATGIVFTEALAHLGYTAYPNAADACFLALYPAMLVGMAVLLRHRGAARDWATLVDATTIATGLGLLSWVFLIAPQRDSGELTQVGQFVVIAYPVGDIVVLAMLTRLLLAAGAKNASFRLLTGSLCLFLIGDLVWAVLSKFGVDPAPVPDRCLDAVFLAAYALAGVAALHPSVRDVAQATEPRAPRLSPVQLATLTAASLIAPAILALQVARHQVTDGAAIVVGSVALFLLVVTRMAQLLRQVERQAGQLRELARVDPLTGLPNRRAWSVELPAAIERCRRDGVPLSVAMLDLDHFKRFNDEYGHQAGDRLLKGAAAAWTGELRAVDQLARYGGEEFIVLFPGSGTAAATAVIERLRACTPAGQTFSAGVGTWDGRETSDELIARADRALYRAKAGGRDRTEAAEATAVPVGP